MQSRLPLALLLVALLVLALFPAPVGGQAGSPALPPLEGGMQLPLPLGERAGVRGIFGVASSPGYERAEATPIHGRIDAAVWHALQAGGEAEVLVILRQQADLSAAGALAAGEPRARYVADALRAVAGASQRDLRAFLDGRGVAYRPFYVVNAVHLRAGEALIRQLAARPEVDRIVLNPWVRAIPQPAPVVSAAAAAGVEENLQRVNADDVWALGYTGQGVVIAGQDTGYDWDHPALLAQYRGWDGAVADHDYNWHDAVHEDAPGTSPGNPCGFDSPLPCDDYGHGTHTLGTMVGDDGAGHQIGVAPGARWIGCRNMEQGVGSPATYLECFEFFLAPYPLGGTPAQGDPARAPDVVNNSWSCPPGEGCDAAILEDAVSALRQAGIAVVVSAGNHGSLCETVLYPPAIYQQSFSVAAFDHRNDQIAAFSSRGPVTYGGRTYQKPDIAAPGVSVYSSYRGGLYATLSGTSMAAPHVAGGLALLLSAAPELTGDVDALERLMMATAQPQTTSQGCGGDGPADVPNNVWGWGILDLLAAVEALPLGTLQGTVADAAHGTPLPQARLTVQVPGAAQLGGDVPLGDQGDYSLHLPTGTYDLYASARCYAPQVLSGIAISGGVTSTLDLALDSLSCVYLPLAAQP
ncbi:MAG: S8 family serine peptidase [Anaerolineae bacterium]